MKSLKILNADFFKLNPSLKPWASGEPNNVGPVGEDYTEMYLTGLWNDLPNSSTLQYVLEIDNFIPTYSYLFNYPFALKFMSHLIIIY